MRNKTQNSIRPIVTIYTDGACRGNPGPGGWGAILEYNGRIKNLSGGENNTTNNRMELMAAIKGLEALTQPSLVELYTDSRYVRDGITSWIKKWKENNWKTSARKPVKNIDLWKALEAALENHEVRWNWVKGHAGNQGNEEVDELARHAIDNIEN